MVYCKIIFENNDSVVFTAGQVMKGVIELHLNESKKINGENIDQSLIIVLKT